MTKNKVGRPLKKESEKIISYKPNLRIEKSKWERLKQLYPGSVNSMFNAWADGLIYINKNK